MTVQTRLAPRRRHVLKPTARRRCVWLKAMLRRDTEAGTLTARELRSRSRAIRRLCLRHGVPTHDMLPLEHLDDVGRSLLA